MKKITIKQYNNLSEKEQELYKPIYGKFRKKRFEDYCCECGHESYYYKEVPVGKPVKYVLMTDSELTYLRLEKVCANKVGEALNRTLHDWILPETNKLNIKRR